MAQILNYKNLLNTFVDESKAYSLDVKNRLNNLFLYHSMGVVEEAMSSRNFYIGIFGYGNGNLVGIPKKVISRISNYYTTLKENISAETTSIQTQFNTCSPSEYEKLYVKNLLYDTLEQQLSETMAQTLKVINSFRDSQNKVATTIDKLNFITSNSYDGQYMNPNGGRVVAFQLTGMTSTTLVNSYTSSTSYFNTYITNQCKYCFYKKLSRK